MVDLSLHEGGTIEGDSRARTIGILLVLAVQILAAGTKDQAKALVKVAIADFKTEGTAVFAKITAKERVQIAKTKGSGWQEYKFSNPVDKKVEAKTAYLEKSGDFIFACGAYSK